MLALSTNKSSNETGVVSPKYLSRNKNDSFLGDSREGGTSQSCFRGPRTGSDPPKDKKQKKQQNLRLDSRIENNPKLR